MSSQFLGLNIASSGLRSANTKINVTNNNIANINTKGYSKQSVESKASMPLLVSEKYGCVGTGVEDISIKRETDNYLNERFIENHAKLSKSEVTSYYNEIIEDYFTTDGGFNEAYTDIINSLDDLINNSFNTQSKGQFISRVESFTDFLNNLYGNLENLQKDIEDEINKSVENINTITYSIANLNKQISVIEGSKGTPNELYDMRDELIKELSAYVDIKCEKGCTIKSSDGVVLADGKEATKINYDETFKTAEGTQIHFNKNGKIAGLIEMKKSETNGIEYYKKQIDEFGNKLFEKINDVFENSYTVNGNKGEKLFVDLTPGKVKINQEIIDNPDKLATKSSVDVGEADDTKIRQSKKILTDKNEFNFRNFSGDGFLKALVNDITMNVNNSKGNVELFSGLENMINERIQSVSGVDSDEEAYDLIKAQKAYELSAKAIQVLNEMYSTLIERTGV